MGSPDLSVGLVFASQNRFFSLFFRSSNFLSILERFGRVWGEFWEGLGRVLEGFGEGLGSLWGRFGEGLGKVWGGFGKVLGMKFSSHWRNEGRPADCALRS